MSYSKRLIILAKSKKHQSYCIAGKDYKTHDWIRPVKNSPFTTKECCNLSDSDRSIRVFDIIEMTFIEKNPKDHQPENETVDMNVKWRSLGTYNIRDLDRLIDTYDLLNTVQDNEFHRTRLDSLNLKRSLQLIRISEEHNAKLFYQQAYGGTYYKPRLKFNHEGINYNLPITDPLISLSLSSRTPQNLRNAYITIGIGEPYRKKHYIFVVMLREIN